MPFNNDQKKLLSLFSENRLIILKSIYNCSENVCNCNLVEKLDLPKNLLSYHIKALKNLSLIKEIKCGRNINYKINESAKESVESVLKFFNLV